MYVKIMPRAKYINMHYKLDLRYYGTIRSSAFELFFVFLGVGLRMA